MTPSDKMANERSVIRRSHLKSKLGCLNCKQRHVKCNEFKPTCGQCHKQGIECSYSSKNSTSEVHTPAYQWPAYIVQACARWKETGRSPFANNPLLISPAWHNMPLINLQYIYQMVLIDTMLSLSNTREMALLWGEIACLIQMSMQFDFVANTVAALSAERLAVRTRTAEPARHALRYRRLAFDGLTQAIQYFSTDNSEAILGCYLCWQFLAPEYRSFMVITRNAVKVVSKMQCRLDHTSFDHLFAYELPADPHRSIVTGPNSSVMAMVSMDFPKLKLVDVLLQGIDALDVHARCFRNEPHFATTLRQQRDTLQYIFERPNESISVNAQYRLLYPFMAWFTRKTESSYIALSQREPICLLFLIYFYSVFVVLVVAMPATDTPFFVSFRVRAVLNLSAALEEGRGSVCQGCSEVHDYNRVTKFPLNAARLYQQHRKIKSDSIEAEWKKC